MKSGESNRVIDGKYLRAVCPSVLIVPFPDCAFLCLFFPFCRPLNEFFAHPLFFAQISMVARARAEINAFDIFITLE